MFDKLSKNYWIKCKLNNVSLSVIMMDIDHFKEYNDNYGHQAGDECLVKLVYSLTKALKDFNGTKDSMIARYGGEEFIMMTCGMSEEEAFKFAESIREKVENLKIKREFKDVADHITLSLGVYTGMPSDETSMLLDYIGNADKALYCAKNDGRNVVRAYKRK
jgi:diguanylate cyclase (GGDEF)-like protein